MVRHMILKGICLAVGFSVLSILALPVSSAPDSAPLFGVWRLNLEKSDFGSAGPGFKRATCTIEPWTDGVRVSFDIIGKRGGVTHTEWNGRFDGRDYPVQGMDALLTNAYTRKDDSTYDILTKVEGKVEGVAQVTISPNGQAMTIVTTIGSAQKGSARTTIAVYEKRPVTPN
jgi:hypothetical protein